MKKKKELLDRKAALKLEMSAKLTALEALGAAPTTEDWAPYNALEAELKQVDEQLASIERLETVTRQQAGNAGAQVRERILDKPWDGLGEQLAAVANAVIPGGSVDPRLYAMASGASESVPSDGGFLVACDFSNEIQKRSYDVAVLAGKCRKIAISAGSNAISIPYLDETSRATGSRWGGVQVYRADEAATVTASKTKVGRMDIKLEKIMGLMYATDELLADATALGSVANQAVPDELAFKIDDEIFSGTGAGRCLGVMKSPALVTVAKETGQAAATIVYENVQKMWARLWAKSRANAVWFVNQDTEPQLQSMALVIGTGGVPVYLPPGGATAAPYATLFGRPVVPIEHCETLGTTGDIVLADLSQYMLIDKGGIKADSSMHVRFLYDEMCFRWTYRINGMPTWKAPLTPYKGTNTLSPFVALATRS